MAPRARPSGRRPAAGAGRSVRPGVARSSIKEADISTRYGHVELFWDTRRFLHAVAAVNEAAFARARAFALHDWEEVEWTKAHHPYMTGNEKSIRENGVIEVEASPDGLHVRLRIGSTSDHTAPEEFGTKRQPAHHPIRNVVDRTAPNIARWLREEARKQGFK